VLLVAPTRELQPLPRATAAGALDLLSRRMPPRAQGRPVPKREQAVQQLASPTVSSAIQGHDSAALRISRYRARLRLLGMAAMRTSSRPASITPRRPQSASGADPEKIAAQYDAGRRQGILGGGEDSATQFPGAAPAMNSEPLQADRRRATAQVKLAGLYDRFAGQAAQYGCSAAARPT